MGEKSGRIAQGTSAPQESSQLDQNIARTLSERIGEERRHAFAHSFAEAVVQELCGHRGGRATITPMPKAVERCHLPPDAVIAARELGRMAASLNSLNAAYFVGSLYTSALPEKYRAGHGIFYTPPSLAEQLVLMAEQGGIDWRTARVLDPACGGGSFLLPIAVRMITALRGTEPTFILQQLAARLRGFDIDVFGSWLAQAMLELLVCDLAQTAGRPLPVLVERRDSLDLREQDFGAYDLVIGNPPYGRVSLTPERRKFFARSVYGHANQYGLFTDAALHWVKRGGLVAYVTPTSMLSGLYYKALRSLLLNEAPPLSINFVNERDGVFADVLQETMLATYRRGGLSRGGTVGFITMSNRAAVSSRKAGNIGLPTRIAAPWLLPRTEDQAMLARRLRSMPHRLADYGYGVSTGPLVWNR